MDRLPRDLDAAFAGTSGSPASEDATLASLTEPLTGRRGAPGDRDEQRRDLRTVSKLFS
jgi:hypothetical protein